MGSMSLEFTGIELAPVALRHTMLRSCTIIIDGAVASRPLHRAAADRFEEDYAQMQCH